MTTVVLAAGRSRRFGWANKLLAPVCGRPLVAITVSRVLAATHGPVVLVVDHQARALRAALVRHGVTSHRLRLVYAPGARHAMSRSRAYGMMATPRLSSAMQIHLADVPFIDARTVGRLRRAIHAGAAAARPIHDGQPGHPVRWSRQRLIASGGSGSGDPQQALRELPSTVWHPVPGPSGCIHDVDRRYMLRTRIGE